MRRESKSTIDPFVNRVHTFPKANAKFLLFALKYCGRFMRNISQFIYDFDILHIHTAAYVDTFRHNYTDARTTARIPRGKKLNSYVLLEFGELNYIRTWVIRNRTSTFVICYSRNFFVGLKVQSITLRNQSEVFQNCVCVWFFAFSFIYIVESNLPLWQIALFNKYFLLWLL